jgi:hypothetical protein
MSVATFEGIVQNGRICLPPNVRLPEKTKVYVIVPNSVTPPPALVASLMPPESARLQVLRLARRFIARSAAHVAQHELVRCQRDGFSHGGRRHPLSQSGGGGDLKIV